MNSTMTRKAFSVREHLAPCLTALLFALGLIVSAPGAWADTIHLKDGRTLVGIIDEVGSTENRIAIRTSAGLIQVPAHNVDRIERQEASSFAETSADLAAAEGDLDRALELYEKALENDPDNEEVQQKIESLQAQIRERNQRLYGVSFQRIEDALENGNYELVVEETQSFINRAQEASAKRQFQQYLAEAHIQIARRYRDRVSYPQAENHYREAIKAYPAGPMPYLELAEMLELSPAKKQEAIPLYQQGIEMASKHPDLIQTWDLLNYRYRLGELYMQQGDYLMAANLFQAVAEEDENIQYPQAMDLAIEAYFRLPIEELAENLEAVEEDLEAIIADRPQDERPYLLLGRIYFHLGAWEDAREMLSAAVENAAGLVSTANLEDAYYLLGVSNRKLGNLDAAARALEQLLRRQTGNYEALCELAEIRLQQDSVQMARTLFEQAKSIDPEKYRAALGLGHTLQKLKEYEAARENFREVVQKDPTNIEAQLAIARTYYSAEDWANASKEARATIDLIESNLQAEAEEASLAEGRIVDPRELNETEKMLMAQAWTLMGDSSLQEAKTNLAREQYQTALEYVEDYAPAFNGIGLTLQADGFHKDAQEYFNKAIASAPDDPDYHLNLGISYHKYLKNPGRALPSYLKYVKLGGKDPNVRTWIEECGGTVPATL